MAYERFARRVSNPEWRKHLRPDGKRDADRAVRAMDRKLVAEFDQPDDARVEVVPCYVDPYDEEM